MTWAKRLLAALGAFVALGGYLTSLWLVSERRDGLLTVTLSIVSAVVFVGCLIQTFTQTEDHHGP